MAQERSKIQWLKDQWEWAKLFFAEDKLPQAPSHKNLIGIGMVVYFGIAYLKTVYYISQTPEGVISVPDVPPGWQLIILGVLGIRALQSAAEKFQNGNGNGNGTQTNGNT